MISVYSVVLNSAALLVAVFAPGVLHATSITLESGGFRAEIDPAVLAVDLVSMRGGAQISQPQASTSVQVSSQTASAVSWTDTTRNLKYQASLDSNGFHLDVRTSTPQSLTWPVIAAVDKTSAFALPLGMGAYVPADDLDWQAHLLHQSPMRMTEGFSMPFAGLLSPEQAVTWLFEEQFHNEINFTSSSLNLLSMAVTHDFTTAGLGAAYRVSVSLEPADPVAPAHAFRRWLQREGQWLPLSEKVKATPDTAKLAGAAHVYLWAGESLNIQDVIDWKGVVADLKHASNGTTAATSILFSDSTPEELQVLKELTTEQWPSMYAKRAFVAHANRLIREWGKEAGSSATEAQKLRAGSEKLADIFPGRLKPVQRWGGAVSVESMDQIKNVGIDRLWLGLDTWRSGLGHPEAVAQAEKNGFLIGPYDSYHSMHPPQETETWETAQFGQELYETGAIIGADGKPKAGFKQKGRLLSPVAAQPFVQKRISSLIDQVPFNSWFFDCDAFGQYYDSYSQQYPQSEQTDLAARLARMQGAAENFGVVVGSEGGVSCAASAIAFAHGLMTPGIAWGDEQMYRDKSSPYYLGRYYPPDAPEVFFKQVELKQQYGKLYFDPAYRLPLYPVALGDSVVATHQWGFPSRKFSNQWKTVRLTELLYGVPPLEHLNGEMLSKWLKVFLPYYRVFSPLLRETFSTSMTKFEWVTADRMVQRSTFAGKAVVTVNFGKEPSEGIAAMSARIDYMDGGTSVSYSP